MRKANVKLSAHNKYELTLLGPDGKVKAKAYAYNVVLNNFWTKFFSTSNRDYIGINYSTCIGTGTGTPAATDTGLFTLLTEVSNTMVSYEQALPTSHCVVSGTFTASASYVGTITEVGMKDLYGQYVSHALLEDAEGNTITIVKTDVDILIVTSTLYLTIEPTSPFELLPAEDQSLMAFINQINSFRPTYDGWFYGYLCAHNPYSRFYPKSIGSVAIHSRTATAATKTYAYSTTRELASSNLNGYMINSLYVIGLGYVMLPNATYFAAYETAYTTVGTGDGTTTEFVCPIPDFVEDTETVKVAGTVMTRDTDYTVDNLGNSSLNFSAKSAYSVFAKVSGKQRRTYGYTGAHTPCFAHYTGGSNSNSIYYSQGIHPDTPLVFDCGAAVTCNTLYLKAIKYVGGSATISGTLHLDYSTDNENWTNIWTSDTISSIAADYGQSSVVLTAVPNGPKFTFTATSARYWRLRFTVTSGTFASDCAILAASGPSTTSGMPAATYGSFFGYTGPGIVFTTAPAASASILIKAQVDRPWKTADYVIDTSFSLTL